MINYDLPPETTHERNMHTAYKLGKGEGVAEGREQVKQELIAAISTTLVRDASLQKVVQLIEDWE